MRKRIRKYVCTRLDYAGRSEAELMYYLLADLEADGGANPRNVKIERYSKEEVAEDELLGQEMGAFGRAMFANSDALGLNLEFIRITCRAEMKEPTWI